MRKMTKLWAMAMTVVMLFTSMNIGTIQANTNETARTVASQWKVKDNSLNKISNGEVMHFSADDQVMTTSVGGGSGNNGIINLDFSVLCVYEDEDGVSHAFDLVFANKSVNIYQMATIVNVLDNDNKATDRFVYEPTGSKYKSFADGEYTNYTDGFDLLYGNALNNDEVLEFAKYAQQFTTEQNIDYFKTTKTNTDGQGIFTGLSDGLYLIMFDDQVVEFDINGELIAVTCTSQPILISTPGYVSETQVVPALMMANDVIAYADFIENGDGTAVLYTGETVEVTGEDVATMSDVAMISTADGDWVYEQDVYPKMGYAFSLVAPEDPIMDVSVEKVWDDDNNSQNKQPDAVTVGLYSNSGNTLYEEVKLTAPDWSHEWLGLSVLDWSIEEVVPTGYEESIVLNEVTVGDVTNYEFTVTNTFVDYEYPLMQINVQKEWTDEHGGDLPVADIPVDEFGNAVAVEIGLFNEDDTEIAYETVELFYDEDPALSYVGAFDDVPKRTDWYLEELSDFEGFDFNIAATPSYDDDFLAIPDYSVSFGVENEKLDDSTKVVSVEKIWDDSNNAYGIRPDKITVGLYKDDVLDRTQDLNAGNHWKHTFYNLDKDFDWTIKEINIPSGYESTMVGTPGIDDLHYAYTITNTMIEYGLMQINVEKEWTVENSDLPVADIPVDEFGNAVAVEIGLFNRDDDGTADDGYQYDSLMLTQEDDWKGAFTDIERRNGWYIDEVTELEWFIPTYTMTDYDVTDSVIEPTFTVDFGVNNEKIVPITILVEKIWEDYNNAETTRPTELEVGLYQDGATDPEDVAILNSENGWRALWTGLDPDSIWTIDEISVPDGYVKKSVVGTLDGLYYAYTITNTMVEYDVMAINVEKSWTDGTGDLPVADIPVDEFGNAVPLEIGLYNRDDDGTADDGYQYDSLMLTQEDDWKGAFEDIERRNGWYIDEVTEVEGFTPEFTMDSYEVAGNLSIPNFTVDFGVENLYIDPDTKAVSVEKIWADNSDANNERPTNVEVGLYKDGVLEETYVLDSTNNWKHTWTGLDETADWTIDEITVPDGYTKTVAMTNSDLHYTYTITNTYPDPTTPPPTTPPSTSTPSVTRKTVTVQKYWTDNNDANNARPTEIIVGLYYNNGKTLYQEVKLNANNNWYYKWTGLLDRDWSIKEISVPDGYEAIYSNKGNVFYIDNWYREDPTIDPPPPTEPPKSELTVKKIWNNDRIQYALGLRPAFIQSVLYCDGIEYDTILLTPDNSWTYTWTDLNPDLNWTVEEKYIPSGYYVSYDKNGDVLEIHNTYQEFVFENVATTPLTQMSEKIPQTGLVDWKMSMLAGFGLLLISLGLFFDMQSKKRHAYDVCDVGNTVDIVEKDCMLAETKVPLMAISSAEVVETPTAVQVVLPPTNETVTAAVQTVPVDAYEELPQTSPMEALLSILDEYDDDDYEHEAETGNEIVSGTVNETVNEIVEVPSANVQLRTQDEISTEAFIRVEAPKRKLTKNADATAPISILDLVMPTTSLMLDKDNAKKSKLTRKKRR